MIEIRRSTDFQSMPWKNGLGTTAQIAIEPSEAQFPKGRFDWRLSTATIQGPNEFSLFPSYRRLLTVWKGAGLCLNGKNILPLEIFEFSGEDSIQCSLLTDGEQTGPVEDFGIIYDPKIYAVNMSIVQPAPEVSLVFKAGVHFLFCVEGFINIAGTTVAAGSIARIEQEPDLKLSAGDATLVWTSISNQIQIKRIA